MTMTDLAARTTTALRLFAAITLITGVAACGTTYEAPKSTNEAANTVKAGEFPHHLFDKVLKKYNRKGFVDYKALESDRGELDDYLAALAKYSPKSHPQLFPSRDDKLAYWINAYNALVFQNVIGTFGEEGYEGKDLGGKVFQTKFFYSNEFTLGGRKVDLYKLENEIVRKDFKEPRIHFALNCASFSCPRLPEEAFVPERLNEQLEREAKIFVMEPRNVDAKGGTATLSQLFNWYGEDFTGDPLVAKVEGDDAKKIAWVNHYRPKDKAVTASAVEYRDYDWSINYKSVPAGK